MSDELPVPRDHELDNILAVWRDRLTHRHDDPELLAACRRLAGHLARGGDRP